MRLRIVNGEWEAGSRIPSHAELSTAFGIAPMTLRQALTALADDGFISLEHGRGTFVRSDGSGAVLIVDDEPAVRILLREYVSISGCRVIEATGPAEGLSAIESHPEIQLLLSDVRMPRSSDGVEFIRTVRRRWPDLPVAAVTAFPDDLNDLHGTPECPVLMITKPFQKQHVEHVLDLTIRAQRAASDDHETNGFQARPIRRPVLVVDDDAGVRRALRDLVETFGYEVEEAATGGQALLALNQRTFGHIFLDLRMPGGSVELAAAISEAHPSSAVVIVTAFPQDVVRLNGAFTVLPKPFDREGVRASLELRRTPVSAR